MITLARCQEMADQIAKEYGYSEHKVIFSTRLSSTWAKIGRTSGKLVLSQKFCFANQDEKIVYDLLKHEFAHKNPESNGHDKVFRETCKNMGISPHTYIDHPEAIVPEKYECECPVCHNIEQCNVKKPCSCKFCSPNGYDNRYIMIWRENSALEKVKKTNIRRRNLR